jgi:hypothetical protein
MFRGNSDGPVRVERELHMELAESIDESLLQ